MTLIELRNKIDSIIKENPSWANVDEIGIVTSVEEDTGWKEIEWLKDIRTTSCDGHGMVAFELVMED